MMVYHKTRSTLTLHTPISRKPHSSIVDSNNGNGKKSDRRATKTFRRRKAGTIKEESERMETAKSVGSRHGSRKIHPKNNNPEDKDQKTGDKKKHNKKMSKKDRPKLVEGTQIRCLDGMYVVEQLLGSGGFGDVYKVKKMGTMEYYAMKTELHEFNGRKIDRLKMEVTAMSTFAAVTNPEKKKHFVDLFDKGQTDTFKLVVMQLVGPSIEDLRRYYLCADFTKGTAMRISQQCLQGIWDLHLTGFIHRDIKPQNFAIGNGDKDDTVYILDLGIAHRFIDRKTNKLKLPRSKVRFMGTVRYASRNCHRSREQCRKDDLETWIYMSVELYSCMLLPWKRFVDRNAVLSEKDKFFADPNPEIYKKAPLGYRSVSKYVDDLTFEEEPNYTLIQSALEQIIKDDGIDIRQPLDWAGRVATKEERDSKKRAKEKEIKNRESRDVSFEKDEDFLEQVDVKDGEKGKNSPDKATTVNNQSTMVQLPAANISHSCFDDQPQIRSEYL